MANAATAAPQPAPQNSLFSLLAGRYGLSTALQLMGLFNPNASAAQKGFGAGQLGGSLAGLAGFKPTIPIGGANIPAIPAALAAGGLGYQLSRVAQNPNLSTKQKIGTSAVDTALIGSSLYGPQAPYVAAFLAANALGGQLAKSGSPQVSTLGRGIQSPLNPISNFLSVLGGTSSPREAANRTIEQTKQTPFIGHALGQMMGFMGLGTKPTTGTMFRRELGNVFSQIPQLKGTNTAKYQAPDPTNALNYSMYKPDALTVAQQLGKILAAYAPHGKANPDAYALQTQNILLNRYGNDLPAILGQVLPMLQGNQKQTAQRTVA